MSTRLKAVTLVVVLLGIAVLFLFLQQQITRLAKENADLRTGRRRSADKIYIPTVGACGAKRFAGLFDFGNVAGPARRSWLERYGRVVATLPSAVVRSIFCGMVILVISTSLNQIGFRLKL